MNNESLETATSRLRLRDEVGEARSEVPGDGDGAQRPPWEASPLSSVLGNRRTLDISAQYRAAADELPTAMLIKSETFTLFESVTALEIMDPKMDSGYLEPGEKLEDEYNVCRELLAEEVIGIMDQLLCCEMAWHEGYPMSQTVFTSHYVDRLLDKGAKSLSDAQFHRTQNAKKNKEPVLREALRTYCIGTVLCCRFVIQKITASGQFYEEEDFSTQTYGRDMFTGLDPVELMRATGQVQDQLQRMTSVDPDLLLAILRRLEFRTLLLSAIVSEQDAFGKNAPWAEASASLDRVVKTHQLGKSVPKAFSPKIQRRLASTVPPRPMVELSFSEAIGKLRNMFRECAESRRILDILGAQQPTSAENLKILLLSFSARSPEPLPYTRACLCGAILGCDDAAFQEFLATNLAETVLPADTLLDPINWTFEAPPNPDLDPDPRWQVATAIGRFTEIAVQAFGGYVDLFKALLSNRCRLRRNLCHVVIGLEKLHTAAAPELDQILMRHAQSHSVENPLTTWAYLEKLRAMELVIQIGFELEIYLEEELAGMFWYLSKIACERSDVASRIASQIKQRYDRLHKGSSYEFRKETIRVYHYLLYIADQGHATASLAQVLSFVFVLLHYLQMFPTDRKANEYTEQEERRRYELRMKPFLQVAKPQLPSFEDFRDAVHPWGPYSQFRPELGANKRTLLNYLRDAEMLTKAAKDALVRSQQHFDPHLHFAVGAGDFVMKDLKNTLQSCIILSLAVARLGDAVRKDSTGKLVVKVEIPGERHPWWIVPQLHGVIV